MNLQDDISSFSYHKFREHFVLVFDLTSMQNATENSHYTKLVGEPLRRELNFTFPLEHVTDRTVWEERMSSSAADIGGVIAKKIWNG